MENSIKLVSLVRSIHDWKHPAMIFYSLLSRDQNPWIEPHFARIQALVAISNHTKTSGGFHCLPGFHQKFGAYAAAHLADRREGDLIDVADECLKQKLCKVTLRPGSLLIWDSRLPHGNWPNNDESFRMVFYMGCHVALQNAELQRRMKLLGTKFSTTIRHNILIPCRQCNDSRWRQPDCTFWSWKKIVRSIGLGAERSSRK